MSDGAESQSTCGLDVWIVASLALVITRKDHHRIDHDELGPPC